MVHLAGTPDDADLETDILPNNVMGMHNLLHAAVACRVKRIVFASSMQVNWYQLVNDSAVTPPPPPISPSDAVTPRLWCVPLPLTLSLLFCLKIRFQHKGTPLPSFSAKASAARLLSGTASPSSPLGWAGARGQDSRHAAAPTRTRTRTRTHTCTHAHAHASSAIARRPILMLQNGRRTHT